jgi:hypothetical protein
MPPGPEERSLLTPIIYDVRFVDGNGLMLQADVSYPGSGAGPGAAPDARQNSARNGATMFFQVTGPGPVTVQWRSSTGAVRRFQVFVTTGMVDQPVQLPIGQELVNASAGGTVEVTATADRAGDASSITALLGFSPG